MTSFEGTLYAGRQAQGIGIALAAVGNDLVLRTHAEVESTVPRDAVQVDAPVPGVPRTLRLPDGSVVATHDHAAVERLWPTPDRLSRIAFRLESSWSWTLASLAATAFAVWVIVAHLLPLAAEPVARLVSPAVERAMGEHVLSLIDKMSLADSTLPEARQDELRVMFEEFTRGDADETDYTVLFRKAGAPNAFALPGGYVIVTDELVAMVESNEELLAVFAHEIGHVKNRHALRLVLQDSGLAVLITALAGDAVGTTILAAALPAALMRAQYSQSFETEADLAAFGKLKRRGISPQVFADFLRRMQQMEGAAAKAGEEGVLRYLSSHPATEERIRRAESAR